MQALDTVLQNTPPGPRHAQLIVASDDDHFDLRPPTILNARRDRAPSTDGPSAYAPRAHTSGRGPRHSLCPRPGPHRDSHQPPGAAGQVRPHAGVSKERLSGIAILPQPCPPWGGQDETPVHMHVGCAHSRLLWPHYRQAVQEAARHHPPEDKALWVASWRSAGAAWTEVFCSGLVPEAAEAQLRAIARYDPPGETSVDDFLHHMLRLEQLLHKPLGAAARVH